MANRQGPPGAAAVRTGISKADSVRAFAHGALRFHPSAQSTPGLLLDAYTEYCALERPPRHCEVDSAGELVELLAECFPVMLDGERVCGVAITDQKETL